MHGIIRTDKQYLFSLDLTGPALLVSTSDTRSAKRIFDTRSIGRAGTIKVPAPFTVYYNLLQVAPYRTSRVYCTGFDDSFHSVPSRQDIHLFIYF